MSGFKPHRLKVFSAVAGALGLTMGAVALGVWVFDLPPLNHLVGGAPRIKPNSALGLILAGFSLLLQREGASRRQILSARVLAFLLSLLGLLILAEYIFDLDLAFGIDRFLLPYPAESLGALRPALLTSITMILSGMGLLTLQHETRTGFRPAEIFSSLSFFVPLTALTSYFYHTFLLLEPHTWSGMSPKTAAAFILLSTGMLCARPEKGWVAVMTGDTVAGYLARRLCALTILMSMALGGFRLLGQQEAFFSVSFGVSLMVVLNIGIAFALIVLLTGRLHHIDLRRREVESKVEESRRELREYIDHMSTFNAKVGLDGAFLLVNKAAVAAAGMTEEEIARILFTEGPWFKFDPEVHNRVRRLFQRAVDGEMINYDERIFVFGRVMTINFSLVPVRSADGKIAYILAEGRDISSQKQAEQSLRESEEKFRAVAQTANDAIVSSDGKGKIIYFNQAAERIFDRTAEETVGQPLTILMPQRYQTPHQQGFARFMASGEPHVIGRTVELAGLNKKGEEFPIELSLSTWKIGEGRFFTAIMRDITERKRNEKEIKGLNLSLQVHSARLEAANKELEAFSYSVSHDLRTPLRALDGFSQVLLEDYAPSLDGTAQDYLQRIRAGSQQMATLIDGMLGLARMTRAEIRHETVDLSALAREAVEEFRRREPERAAQITIADNLSAQGDKILLRAVVENLLGNAWKFTRNSPEALIEFGSEKKDGDSAFFVRDNGAGFDMAYADKLFSAFQRLHKENEFPGTGIGLATVQRIVAKHGGRVWGEAAVGRGATFYFTLGEGT